MPRRRKFLNLKLFGKKLKITRKTTKNLLAVLAFLAFLLSGLSLASIFGLIKQGEALFLLRDFLMLKFGGFAFFVPFLFLFLTLHLINTKKLKIIKWNFTTGYLLIFISILALNKAGEYGVFLYENISAAFSSIGAVIILVFSFITGIILFFDFSISDLVMIFIKTYKLLIKILSSVKKQIKQLNKDLTEKSPTDSRSSQTQEEIEIKINANNELKQPAPKKPEAKEKQSSQNMIKPLFTTASTKSSYIYPPLSLLEDLKQKNAERGDVKKNAQIIEQTLESFGIRAKVVEVNYGPAVTQYALKITMGTKLSKITALANDLALNLAAPRGQVRIEAPIPGRSLVGIEIPNIRPQIVTLKDILSKPAIQKESNPTIIPLGLDVGGKVKYYPISKMPHVLIAGATGSGKSVLLNSWVCTFLMRTSPEQLRLIMVDPKRVEMTIYNGIPHLLTNVIVEPDQTVSALRWTVKEMEARYKEFAKLHVRNIEDYNALPDVEKKPYIIFVIDELADLMLFAPGDVEELITRLAQMARAVGIHLVLATQRPSVDVITGLMKANIPTRIAFNVSSMVDSRVIIDGPGAEKLLGKGDMLFLPPDQAKPHRIQGPFISSKEVKNIIEFLKAQNPDTSYQEEIVEAAADYIQTSRRGTSIDIDGKDVLFEKAVQLIMQQETASASFLQRRLSIGFARAARILDQLEKAGYIGPAEGSKPRKVLRRQTPQE